MSDTATDTTSAAGATTDTSGGNQQQNAGHTTDHDSGSGGGFQPITSQEQLDKVIGPRLARERQKYADYADLQAAAAELKAIKDGEKSDLEKEREARAQFEQEARAAKYELMRERVAARKKVPANSISGNTEEELEASADALLEWQRQAAADTAPQQRRKRVDGDFKSGATGSGASGADKKTQAAEALRRLRKG